MWFQRYDSWKDPPLYFMGGGALGILYNQTLLGPGIFNIYKTTVNYVIYVMLDMSMPCTHDQLSSNWRDYLYTSQ